MMIKDLNSPEQFEEILQTSQQRPVFLFKHSTSCFTSSYAWRIFQKFAASEARPEHWRVLVLEQRALSQHLARQTGVQHESPQVLLLHEGKVVWHDSHEGITANALQKNLDTVLAREGGSD